MPLSHGRSFISCVTSLRPQANCVSQTLVNCVEKCHMQTIYQGGRFFIIALLKKKHFNWWYLLLFSSENRFSYPLEPLLTQIPACASDPCAVIPDPISLIAIPDPIYLVTIG